MVAILSQIVEFRNGESGLHVSHINQLTNLLLERLVQNAQIIANAIVKLANLPLE